MKKILNNALGKNKTGAMATGEFRRMILATKSRNRNRCNERYILCVRTIHIMCKLTSIRSYKRLNSPLLIKVST